jgi:hypothetical protein
VGPRVVQVVVLKRTNCNISARYKWMKKAYSIIMVPKMGLSLSTKYLTTMFLPLFAHDIHN